MHEITIKLPNYIYEIMKDCEKETNTMLSHQIIESIRRQLVVKGYISPKVSVEEYKGQTMPEANKYCDGDKCNV